MVWGVVVIGHTYRHHDMAHMEVQLAREALLHPKLFQRHFGAAVFKLHFGSDAPATAHVVAQHDDGMGDVHPPMSLTLGIAIGMGLAKNVVAIEIVVIHSLAIPTYDESLCLCCSVVLGGRNLRDPHHQNDKNEYFANLFVHTERILF